MGTYFLILNQIMKPTIYFPKFLKLNAIGGTNSAISHTICSLVLVFKTKKGQAVELLKETSN
jgi:hypothetical protein